MPDLGQHAVFILAAYGATTGMISAAGLPLPPLAYAVAVAIELGGGLLLVAGYQTEYSSIKFALFMLAEYVHVVTLSALATTLFLGGWRALRATFAIRSQFPPTTRY